MWSAVHSAIDLYFYWLSYCIRPTFFSPKTWAWFTMYKFNLEWNLKLYFDLGSLEWFHSWLAVIPHFDLSDKSLNTLVDSKVFSWILATQISFFPLSVNSNNSHCHNHNNNEKSISLGKDSEPRGLHPLSSHCYLHLVTIPSFLMLLKFLKFLWLRKEEKHLSVWMEWRQNSVLSSIVLSFQILFGKTLQVPRTCWAQSSRYL